MRLLLCLTLFLVRTLADLVVSALSTDMNALTNYTFTLNYDPTNSPVDAAGWTVITIPTQYYPTSSLTGISCSISCSILANNINISHSQVTKTTDPNTLIFTLHNIVNPNSKVSPLFTYTQYNSTGVTVTAQEWGSFSTVSGKLSSCVITFNPNNVRKLGNTTVTITPTNQIPVNGTVLIRFPMVWDNSKNSDLVISSTTVNCLYGSGNLYSTLSCAKSNISTSSQFLVTMSNAFSSSSKASFSFQINPVLSYPLSTSSSQVSASTQDTYGNDIDSYTTCTVSAPNPNQMTLTLSGVSTVAVSKTFTPSFSFVSTDLISIGDTIRFTIPSQLTQVSVSTIKVAYVSTSSYSQTYALDTTGSNSTSMSYTISTLTNSIFNAGGTVTYTTLSFISPPSTRPTSDIKIQLLRDGSAYSYGTVSMTALAGTLTSPSIFPGNYQVNAATTYTINFTIASPLSSTASVVVTLPSSITVTSYAGKSCTVSGSTNVSTSGTCTMASNNTMTLSSFLTGSIKTGANISFTFDGVKNPGSTKPTSAFIVETKYETGNNYNVDTVSSLTLTATAETTASLTASPGSSIVGVSSVYNLSYILKNQLPISGIVLIGIPIGMTYQNSASATVSVKINGVSLSSVAYSINPTSTTAYSSSISITNLASSAVLSSATVLEISISKLVNPSSTKTSNSFCIYLTTSDNNLIQSQTSGATVKMTAPNIFSVASVVPNSIINGDSTFYIFTIRSPIDLEASSILKISIPSQLTLSSPTCSSLTGTATSLNCNITSGVLLLTLQASTLSNSLEYKYQVNGFTNPRTYTRSDNFTFSLYTSDSLYQCLYSTILGVSNSQENLMMSLTSTVTSPSQSYLNCSQTIKFTLTTKNSLFSTDYLELTFPSGYVYENSLPTTSSICAEPTYTCLPYSTNSLRVKIAGSFSNQSIFSFTISGYRSPPTLQYLGMSQYFKAYSFQADTTPIDITDTTLSATKTTFSVSCNSNCQTCSTSSTTTCLTCYPSTISNYQYLQNSACVSTCSVGYYASSTNCVTCISPCSSCSNSTACLSCLDSSVTAFYFYYSSNFSCLNSCPAGYYGAASMNYTCTPCSSSCLTCSLISTNCTSCNSPSLLQNNVCVTSCSAGKYKSSGSCLACDLSCLTCENDSISCLICSANYVRNGTICTNTCASGTVPYNGVCSCSVSCKTCSGTFDNCTSCDPTSVNYPLFYSNTCVGSCPSSTYQNSGSCTSCPTGCATCSSSSNCLTCTSTYIFYNNKCLASCPASTYSDSTQCLACQSPCATCTTLATNCTSCNSTTSLQGNVCKTNCSSGIPVSTSNGNVCQSCSGNCSTCSGTVTNCTSCLASSNTNLYNNACIQYCPASYLAVSGVCDACISPCLTCSISTSNCLSCKPQFYTINQTPLRCVSDCSSAGLFINGSTCISCQSPCSSCSGSAYSCTACQSGKYLEGSSCVSGCSTGYITYQGKCLSSCPTGTKYSNGTCVVDDGTTNNNSTNNNSTNNNSTNNNTNNRTTTNATETTITLNSSITASKIIPFPFVIADFMGIGLAFVSKFASAQSSLCGMSVSLNGALEAVSWLTVPIVAKNSISPNPYTTRRLLFSVTSLLNTGLLCIMVGAGIHILLNILAFFAYQKYILPDPHYQKWLKANSHNCIHKFSMLGCILISHKFCNLPFSKAFGSSYFKAPLSNPVLFTPINILMGISLLPSVIIITGCTMICLDSTTVIMSSLYIQAIDAIIITTINLIFSVWSLRKPDDYFDENYSKVYGQQIYNETIDNLNHGSELNDRYSIQEEAAAAGRKPIHSRVISNSSKVKNTQRSIKQSKYFAEGEPRNYVGINIHEASSQYVSEGNDSDNIPSKQNTNSIHIRAPAKKDKESEQQHNIADTDLYNKPTNKRRTQNNKVAALGVSEVETGKEKTIVDKIMNSDDEDEEFEVDNQNGADMSINPITQQKISENEPKKKNSNSKSKQKGEIKQMSKTEESPQKAKDGKTNTIKVGNNTKKNQKTAKPQISKNKVVPLTVKTATASDSPKKTMESNEIESEQKQQAKAAERSSEEEKLDEIQSLNIAESGKNPDSIMNYSDTEQKQNPNRSPNKNNSHKRDISKGQDNKKQSADKKRNKSKGKDSEKKVANEEKREREMESSLKKKNGKVKGEKKKGEAITVSEIQKKSKSKEKNILKDQEPLIEGIEVTNNNALFRQTVSKQLTDQEPNAQSTSPRGIANKSNLKNRSPSKQEPISPRMNKVKGSKETKSTMNIKNPKKDILNNRDLFKSGDNKLSPTKKFDSEKSDSEAMDGVYLEGLQEGLGGKFNMMRAGTDFQRFKTSQSDEQEYYSQHNSQKMSPDQKHNNMFANDSLMIRKQDSSESIPVKPSFNTDKSSAFTSENVKRNRDSQATKIDSKFIDKIFDDNESLRSAEDAYVEFNEISPSEFNVQNQRFDELVTYEPVVDKLSHISFKKNVSPSKRPPSLFNSSDSMGVPVGADDEYEVPSVKSNLYLMEEVNLPRVLPPEHRQRPPQGSSMTTNNLMGPSTSKMTLDPGTRYGKSFVRNDTNQGYDAVFDLNRLKGNVSPSQKMGQSGNPLVDPNRATNDIDSKRLRSLEKIYLQRLDVRADTNKDSKKKPNIMRTEY